MKQYNMTTRFFAAMLMLGGVVGFISTCIIGIPIIQQHSFLGLPMVGLAALFVWSVFIGYRLWQGTPFGRKWATILFASQIPVLALPSIAFHWFTGLQLRLVMIDRAGDVTANVTLGAGGAFYVGTGVTEFMIGINVFAVIALLLLRRANKALTHQAHNHQE